MPSKVVNPVPIPVTWTKAYPKPVRQTWFTSRWKDNHAPFLCSSSFFAGLSLQLSVSSSICSFFKRKISSVLHIYLYMWKESKDLFICGLCCQPYKANNISSDQATFNVSCSMQIIKEWAHFRGMTYLTDEYLGIAYCTNNHTTYYLWDWTYTDSVSYTHLTLPTKRIV